MKFSYSKKSTILQCVFNALLMIGCIIHCIVVFDGAKEIRYAVGVSAGIIAITAEWQLATCKQYVLLNDNHIYFYSFLTKSCKLINLKVYYRDVQSITCRCFPLIGISSVKISFRNTQHKIKLTLFDYNDVKLFNLLCQRVKSANENVYIDPQLRKYMEKEQSE